MIWYNNVPTRILVANLNKILKYPLLGCNFIASVEDFLFYMHLSDKIFVILH